MQLRRQAASERGLRGAQEPGLYVLHELVAAAGMCAWSIVCVICMVYCTGMWRIRGWLCVSCRRKLGLFVSPVRPVTAPRTTKEQNVFDVTSSNALGRAGDGGLEARTPHLWDAASSLFFFIS